MLVIQELKTMRDFNQLKIAVAGTFCRQVQKTRILSFSKT